MKSPQLLLLSIYLLSSNAHAMRPISHNVASYIEYVEGEFASGKDNKATYTVPYRPEKAPTQSVLVYKGFPQEPPHEKILMRKNLGKDGRSRILNTTQWPYLFHAQLSLHFSDGEYGGSGVLVGPHHILTAAHNVYSHKTNEWAKNVIARLALNDSVAPFGELSAIRFYTFKEWTEDRNPNFDLALITLSRSIGLDAGWTGVLAEDDKILESEEIHVTGYPGDKGFNQLWTMSHRVKKLDPERIFYEADTYGGQSGGSVWIHKYGNPYAIGIHTLGEGKLYEGNSGIRLSHKKVEMVLSWISLTRDIKQNLITQPREVLNDVTFFALKTREEAKSEGPSTISTQPVVFTLPQLNNVNTCFPESPVSQILPKTTDDDSMMDYTPSLSVEELKVYYEQGNKYEEELKFQDAFDYYGLAAKHNYAPAQYALGEIYLYGRAINGSEGLQFIIQPNIQEALKWYEQAAHQGLKSAHAKLGWAYKNHKTLKELPDSYKKALFHLQEAIKQGDSSSEFELADMYVKGLGVDKNLGEAKKLYIKNAQYYSLAKISTYPENLEYYSKSAEQGCIEAQYDLGFIYQNGLYGFPVDLPLAIKWYKRVATNPYAMGSIHSNMAKNALGKLYEASQNYQEAIIWYKAAAEFNAPGAKESLKRLGVII